MRYFSVDHPQSHTDSMAAKKSKQLTEQVNVQRQAELHHVILWNTLGDESLHSVGPATDKEWLCFMLIPPADIWDLNIIS